MKILNILTGALDLIFPFSFVRDYFHVKALYVLEVIICVLSCIFLYLSWAWYCDTRELDDKELDKKDM